MRSLWKGALSFGLVNIPVHMYTATQRQELSFVLLHKKDLSEIRYARFCKLEDKEVPWKEIVKAYEYKKGDFVVLEDEDFKKANLEKTKSIEIINFIFEKDIDPIYYVKPYFLEPGKNAENAYSLLREALKKSKKVGLAKFVLRNREHLAVIKTYENLIILNELRYNSEIVNFKELNIPPQKKFLGQELNMAIQLIDQLTVGFDPENYQDTYIEEMKEVIDKKSKGRPIHPKTKEAPSPKVHDIMSLLQASLETKKKPPKKSHKSA